jgi:hypothetical protein
LFKALSVLSASGLVSLGMPRLEYRSQRHVLQVGSSSIFECMSPSRINERSRLTAGRWQLWHLVTGASFASSVAAILSTGSQAMAGAWSSGSLIRLRTAWLILAVHGARQVPRPFSSRLRGLPCVCTFWLLVNLHPFANSLVGRVCVRLRSSHGGCGRNGLSELGIARISSTSSRHSRWCCSCASFLDSSVQLSVLKDQWRRVEGYRVLCSHSLHMFLFLPGLRRSRSCLVSCRSWWYQASLSITATRTMDRHKLECGLCASCW